MWEEAKELLDQIDMEWVLDREGVSHRDSYGRSGRQLNVRACPFCGSNDYRVYVNADSGVGNCFSGGCPQKTFSKWTFLKGLYSQSGNQLLLTLRKLAQEQGWRPKRTSVLTIADLNSLYLPESKPVAEMEEIPEYLARRGVDRALAEYFGLRWCEQGSFEVVSPDGRKMKQDYSKRVIIPVFDLEGELVTFQGRDGTGEHEKRYLFPPGFASTGSYLYNGWNVVPGVDHVVICEGAFDVIGVKIALDTDFSKREATLAVGTFGMHLSEGNNEGNDQLGQFIKLRGKGVKRLTFLWDGEAKATFAAAKSCLSLLKMGFECYVAMLPKDKDPGEAKPVEILSAIQNAKRIRTGVDIVLLKGEVAKRYPEKPLTISL